MTDPKVEEVARQREAMPSLPVANATELMQSAPGKNMYAALLEVQKELPKLQKSAINPHFKNKYIPLEELNPAVLAVLNAHDFIWLTMPTIATGGDASLSYSLIYTPTRESITGIMKLEADKTGPQGQGGAITYARRYALMAVLGLVADTDDDGQAAQDKVEAPVGSVTASNIYALLKKLNVTATELEKQLGKPIDDLTTAEANDIIQKLKAKVMRASTETVV